MTYALLAGLCFYISRQFAEAAVVSYGREYTIRATAARTAIIAAVVLMFAALLIP